MSRESYRTKTEQAFVHALHNTFGDFYLIPEGGTNELAVMGVIEYAQSLGDDFDYLCCAVGTGGTLAGLINGLEGGKEVYGFPVLKGAEFLKDEIEKLLPEKYNNWRLFSEYHFGGYAKSTVELLSFIKSFHANNKILLDSVYMGKLFFGVFDLVKKDYFKKGATVLVLHSGGLQGQSNTSL